jgi:hypothetical protein
MRSGALLDWWPWPACAGFGLLIAAPPTKHLAHRLQTESGLIEWASAAMFAAAALLALLASRRAPLRRERILLLACGFVLVFVAGEEIAWGQHLLGRPLSAAWAEANSQGETTLHNLPGMQGKSELWYLVPAAAGLLAIRWRSLSGWLGAAAMPKRLQPALLLVAGYALAEAILAAGFRDAFHRVQDFAHQMKELIEFVIGWIALRWAWAARATAAAGGA